MANNVDSLISDFAARIRSSEILPVVHKPHGTTPLVRERAPEPRAELEPPRIMDAQFMSAQDLLFHAASRALEAALSIRRGRWTPERYQGMLRVFQSAVVAECERIERASKTMMTMEQAKVEIEAERKKAREAISSRREKAEAKVLLEENQARHKLARDLKAAKSKLRSLQNYIAARKVDAERVEARINQLGIIERVNSGEPGHCYPEVPRQMIEPHPEGKGLPEAAGVYFLWKDGAVDYVGQSTRLCNRLRPTHDVLRSDHRISYVLVDPKHLLYAEAYYIGLLRPRQNFGAHIERILRRSATVTLP